MTKDEIIALANQAGFAEGVVEIVGLYGFMKFANLVAEAEREACAKLCEDLIGTRAMAVHCADAIRARGNA